MNKVPKKIHQIYTKGWYALPESIVTSIEKLKQNNPHWTYHFYDTSMIKDFIRQHYGEEMLNTWLMINPEYGAARADFFRYLMLYVEGGVYLDIKSACSRPLDEVIPDDCQLLLCSWQSTACGRRKQTGRHEELSFLENGEYQQWNITVCARSPWIKGVIDEVVSRIKSYKPWIYGIGRMGVLRTTGPVPFSIAIARINACAGFYHIENYQECGFVYTSVDKTALKQIKKSQYARLKTPVVKLSSQDHKKYVLWLWFVFPFLRLKKNIINETRNLMIKLRLAKA
jgi:mannosyltransferase OCH1-like enzyme